MSDQPPSNTLDPTKFYVAVRLIQLFQNGKKPIDAMLNVTDVDKGSMRAPFFEGVDVQAAMAKLASSAQQQQPFLCLGSQFCPFTFLVSLVSPVLPARRLLAC